jgi:DNA-binding transcriptional ArsR family regulator
LDAVRILRSDREAKLIFDDMRREILRILAKEAVTAQRLAKIMGLSAPTVGYHLDALKRSGLVEISATEVESHGMLQKFYRSTAQAFIIEPLKLSPTVRRYFMPARIERTRGMVAALSLNAPNDYKPSSHAVEVATDELGRSVLEAAERRKGPSAEMDPECVLCGIYSEALWNLLSVKPKIFPTLDPAVLQGMRPPVRARC